MKTKLLIAALCITAGCVDLREVMHNSTGQEASCANVGAGLIGSMIATSRHEECKQRLKDKGYK